MLCRLDTRSFFQQWTGINTVIFYSPQVLLLVSASLLPTFLLRVPRSH